MVDDGLRAEAADATDRLHTLLLTLTGRVDDDAVNESREMLGIGQVDAAAEFLTGCLLAGRIPVTSTEQYHLRRVLDESRSMHTLADRLQVVDSVPSERHRFSEHSESDADLVDALAPITARLTGVRAVWCTWRVTPAGVTYGAVPKRVVLAEVGSDGSVVAAGYQLLEALRRAGLDASVDVFGSGADLPEYHRDALAAARRVHLDVPPVSAVQNGSNHARAPRSSSGGEPARSEPARRADPVAESTPASEEATSVAVASNRSAALAEQPPAERIAEEAAPEAVRSEPVEQPSAPEAVAEPTPAEGNGALESDAPASHGEGKGKAIAKGGAADGSESKNMRVPAAVDAKLTDRERNLLRKLHEELAQREHDRDEDAVPSRNNDSYSTTPGTGGFPPMHKS